MNKPTKYTAELLHFLENEENYPEMIEWIEDLPELDQPDVLREMEAIFKDRHLKTGEQDWLDKANYIADGIGDFEEEILDEKLHKTLFMIQFDNVEFETEKVKLFLIEARKSILETILSNPKNIKEVMKLALLSIKLEKETGIYDQANWSAIF